MVLRTLVVHRAAKKIDKQELMFLTTGGVGLENTIPNPGPGWLLDKSWDEMCRLDEITAYRGTRLELVLFVCFDRLT